MGGTLPVTNLLVSNALATKLDLNIVKETLMLLGIGGRSKVGSKVVLDSLINSFWFKHDYAVVDSPIFAAAKADIILGNDVIGENKPFGLSLPTDRAPQLFFNEDLDCFKLATEFEHGLRPLNEGNSSDLPLFGGSLSNLGQDIFER
jgi:hypothetical protein